MKLPLELFWAEMLSREAERVVAAWQTLAADEQQAVWNHLERMVTEPDWSEPQRLSAQAALAALHDAGCSPAQ